MSLFKYISDKFNFLIHDFGFHTSESKEENMYFVLKYEKGSTYISVYYERRDNYIDFKSKNLYSNEESSFDGYNGLSEEEYFIRIDRTAIKVKNMCINFLKS